jgi:uncharacterized protein involved in cysteine biosynthesis
MPSIRSLSFGSSVAAACAFAGVAAAQPEMGSELGFATRIGLRFAVVLVINLVLGGALLGITPEYARRMVTAIRDDAGTAFLWGLLAGVAVPIALVLIAITIIGLLVTIPGLIALFFVGLVGNAVTICWVGTLLTGRADPDGAAVGVGAAVLAAVGAVPLLGNLVTTLLGFVGLGVVGRDLYTSWRD